jgi:hypothetical protein
LASHQSLERSSRHKTHGKLTKNPALLDRNEFEDVGIEDGSWKFEDGGY